MNTDQITGVLRALITAAAGWAVGKGYITNDIAANLVLGGTTIGVAVWSAAVHSPAATIAAVNNADNGVRAVDEKKAIAAGIPPVDVPLK